MNNQAKMPKQESMHLWIVMVKEESKNFDPLLDPSYRGDGQYIWVARAYARRKDATERLNMAKSRFGKRNAYLQKVGAIS